MIWHRMRLVLVSSSRVMERAMRWAAAYGGPGEAPDSWPDFWSGGLLGRKEIEQMVRERAESNREWWLYTMNPLVADYYPLMRREHAKAQIFTCSGDGEPLPLSDEDAARVWEAYEAGVETLGQILETRGLW